MNNKKQKNWQRKSEREKRKRWLSIIASDTRMKNWDWKIISKPGKPPTLWGGQLAVLMDLRDEMQSRVGQIVYALAEIIKLLKALGRKKVKRSTQKRSNRKSAKRRTAASK